MGEGKDLNDDRVFPDQQDVNSSDRDFKNFRLKGKIYMDQGGGSGSGLTRQIPGAVGTCLPNG